VTSARVPGSGAAALAALLLITGCSELFGFERSDGLAECIHDSDCPGAQLCLSNSCHPSQDEDESGAAAAAGVCDPSCQEFSVCQSAACLGFQRYGYQGAGLATLPVAGGNLIGIQIPLTACGILTGIGFVNLHAEPGLQFRFGVYKDNGGHPDQWMAQTPESTLQEGTDEVPVESPITVGCDGATTYVWVVGIWLSSGVITFECEDSPVYPWMYGGVDPAGVLAGGLPNPFPSPATGFSPGTEPIEPHIYMIITNST
jgi:hypothetical protein